MSKKKTIPSTFENAFSGLGYGNAEETAGVTNMDHLDSMVDVEPTFNDDPEPDKGAEENNSGVEVKEDTTDIPQEVLNLIDQSEPPADNGLNDHDNEEPTNDDITEAKQVGAFFDAVAEKFGWSDIEDDERPVNIEEFTQYMQDVVDQNSVPQYADERVAQLDAFIKNGGNFEDFYKVQQQRLSYDNLDLEDESNQRAVVADLLRASGYDDNQISRKLDRYENAGTLEEEAEEALDKLKQIRAAEVERMSREQEQARKNAIEQQRAFFDDVNKQIQGLSDIRGIAIPKEDRKALLEYIFKTDSDGMSQYQKDFNKNLSKNLIESAYFTMKADSLINEAKKTGQTTAAQKLRQMLRHTSKNHSSYNADEEKQRSAWEIASKFL